MTALLSFLGVGAVWHYELALGGALGAFLVVFIEGLRMRRSADSKRQRQWFRLVGQSLPIFVIPTVAVLYGRKHVGGAAEAYGGTTIGSWGRTTKTVWLHFVSGAPGTSWPLAHEVLGGAARLTLLGLIATAVAALLVYRLVESFNFDLKTMLTTALALAAYFVVACGILGATEKVQNETSRVGQVYLEYIVGVVFWVFVILILIAAVKKYSTVHRLLMLALLVLSTVQFTTNWRLAESLNRSFVPNRQLVAAYRDKSSESERCLTLWNWRNGNWPDYYRDTMTEGLNLAYREYFKTDFCR
jgi:hypothetical protein